MRLELTSVGLLVHLTVTPQKVSYGSKASLNKFPGFFLMVTFIDSKHMKL